MYKLTSFKGKEFILLIGQVVNFFYLKGKKCVIFDVTYLS